MPQPLRVLIVEDNPDDAKLLLLHLQRGGYDVVSECVETADTMAAALERPWDLVVSDYAMPRFSAAAALELLRRHDADIPFIVISGTVGEEAAVAAMRRGVSDYILKGHLVRLLPAVEREMAGLESRRERRKAEQDVRRLAAIVEGSDDAIIGKTLAGEITTWNRGAERLYGWTADEMVGTTVTRVIPPDRAEELPAVLGRLSRGEGVGHLETVRLRKDGTRVDVSVTYSPVRDAEGRTVGVSDVARDIGERLRGEAARLAAEIQMAQAQKLESLGVLAGGLAHDLNNMLTPVLGYAELARESLPEGSLADPMLCEVQKAARHAADLVQQILAYSGKGRFVIGPVDLSGLVRGMEGLLRPAAKAGTFRYELADDLPAVEADATQIRQVIMNLVLNASEALGEDGTVTVRTGLVQAGHGRLRSPDQKESLPPGPYAFLEVEDTGCGMTAATREKMFDPFFTTRFTGRGLGLAVVQGIARGHRGTIAVRSEPGQGSAFRVLLPCSMQTLPPAAGPAPLQQDAWQGTGAVLVIDDEVGVRQVACLFLERAGFSVLPAGDGTEGLTAFRGHPGVALVLLDLTMPGLSGFVVAETLREMRPDVPVVLMSGYSVQELQARSEGRSLAGFIQKPFTQATLLAAVRQALVGSVATSGVAVNAAAEGPL